ncbi:MAG: DNA internalization-related competence protein ComEC/Rec2 [Bacillota bacterium]|nr:DNA internalization-related competence protein ComEC/Rec2 [Bacillota bacterium]
MMKRPLAMAVLLVIASLTMSRYVSGSSFLYIVLISFGVLWLAIAVKRRVRWFWWFMGFLLVLGFVYGDVRLTEPPVFPLKDEGLTTVTGEVLSYPEDDGATQTFLFRTTAVEGTAGTYDLHVSASSEEEIEPGDLLEIKGTGRSGSISANPGVFGFDSYLENLQVSAIFSTVYDGSVVHQGQARHLLQSGFFWLRHRFEAATSHLTENGAAIIHGIFLGDTSSLDQEILDVLTKTGIRHCFCVSGLHVGYVVLLVLLPCSLLRVSAKKQWLLLLPLLVVYCGITGFQPAVVRASVMALVLWAGYGFGRQFDPYSSLSLAALMILLWNPWNLWQVGFQLSFGAVLSIFLFQKFFRKLLPKKGPATLWNALAVTFAAQVGIIPLIAYYFHVVSVISFLLSPLICLIVGGIVIISLTALILAVVSPFAAAIFLYSAEALSALTMALSALASTLPGAYFSCPGLSLWWVAVTETLLCITRFAPWFRDHSKLSLGMVMITLSFFLAPFSPFHHNDDFTVTFLSVGNGDCIHIHTSEQKNYLIDAAGAFGNKDSTAVNIIRPYLLNCGVTSLDGIFCTHGDTDHSGGIPYLLSYFPTETLYLSSAARDSYGDLKDVAAQHGAVVTELSRGDKISLEDGALLEVLSPETADYGPDNELSLVMRLTKGETSLLFTGDVGGYGMTALVEDAADCSADILQLPHHGSATGYSTDFYHKVNPEAVVASLGQNNDHFPADSVAGYWRQKGIPFYRTDEDGAVTFLVKDDSWEVSCYLPDGTARRTMERRLYHSN